MQDRTINNALLHLCREGGSQGRLAEVLCELRGVDIPARYSFQPFKCGTIKRLVIEQLRTGPKTIGALAGPVREANPALTHHQAYNRAYHTLHRLKDRGVVVRDGEEWGLAP